MNAEVHALAGAYALDALPPEESAAFAEHLTECAACREEVAGLQATAAQLGLNVPEAPPAALRERVLQAAHQTRQVPPSPAPRHLSSVRGRSRARWLAAAAAAVVIAGAGLLAVRSAVEDRPPEQELIAAVMTAPDASSGTARLRGGGAMTVVVSDRLDRAVVLTQDLPPVARSRVYQLWLVDARGGARSADVLIRPDAAAGRTRLVDEVRPGDRIAITREPAGGSRQPSMTPLAVVEHT